MIGRTLISAVVLSAIAGLAGTGLAAVEERISVTSMQWRGQVLAVRAPAIPAASPALRGALSLQISVDWQEAGLRDIVGFLHRHTGANIVLDPALEQSAPPITFTASGMTAGRVLDWVTKLSGGTLSLVGEAAWLGKQPYRAASTRLVLYDVTDIASPIRNFPGPTLAMEAGGTQASLLPFVGDDHGQDAATTAADLADFLEEHLNNR